MNLFRRKKKEPSNEEVPEKEKTTSKAPQNSNRAQSQKIGV